MKEGITTDPVPVIKNLLKRPVVTKSALRHTCHRVSCIADTNKINREYYEKLYVNKSCTLFKIDKYIKRYKQASSSLSLSLSHTHKHTHIYTHTQTRIYTQSEYSHIY